MHMKKKATFEPPLVLQMAEVQLDRDLLVGSPEMRVEIDGQLTDEFYDLEAPESTFNTIWD